MHSNISVRAIIYHQGKLLCFKLKSNRYHPDKYEFWSTPGGGLDDHESLIDCLVREMIEETNIKPSVGNLLYVQQFSVNDKDYLDFMFEVKNVLDYLSIDLTKTSHGQAEVEETAFVDPKTTYILPTFLSTRPIGTDIKIGKTNYYNNF